MILLMGATRARSTAASKNLIALVRLVSRNLPLYVGADSSSVSLASGAPIRF